MPSIKPEPTDTLPEIRSGSIAYPPDIKSETVEYTPGIPPTKRLKTLTPISPWPSSKGKSKIEEDDDDDSLSDQQLDTCGVCLSEEGFSLRGFIDSCEHYFCFVCIMEWAKVESRCPICKRRFSTIRRPPKDGIFLSERVVEVPVRDQVYCVNGNATIGPADPYSQVKCSVCSLSTDENLLLLCDLCDSAAHSYCVGLGATVPDDDWFCQDCTLSRDEHSKIETDTNHDTDPCSSRSNIVQFTRSNVSINDMVRESSINEPDPSSIVASFNQNESNLGRTSNARTLKRCLNVHARIKVLRENWDGFRGGSLSFSSNDGNGFKAGQQKSTSQKDSHGNVSPDRGSYNVDKAWKMMDIAAKAIGRKPGKKIFGGKESKHHLKKERLVKEPPNNTMKSVGTSRNYDEKCRFQTLKPTPSSRNIVMSTQVNNCCYNSQNLSRKEPPSNGSGSSCLIRPPLMATEKDRAKKDEEKGGSKNVTKHGSGSSYLIRPPLMATEKDHTKKDEEKGGSKNVTKHDNKSKKVEDAKSEIQSLVKLNLKLLSRDKKLEVDVFKEVARHATHSILAACGIESPKAGFCLFPRLVCDHCELQKRPRSTLMPTSCRECFFVFVKDVVNTIAFERTGKSLV